MFTRQLKNFISLLVLILMVNCASQKSYLNKAMQENTIEAYKGFLQKYPNGEYSEKVKKHLIKLEFDKAKNENTIKAYEIFLQKAFAIQGPVIIKASIDNREYDNLVLRGNK